MALENKIELVWTREDCERVLGFELTDQEWVSLASELEGELEERIIPATIGNYSKQNIASLVAEDEKYDTEEE